MRKTLALVTVGMLALAGVLAVSTPASACQVNLGNCYPDCPPHVVVNVGNCGTPPPPPPNGP